MIVEVGKWIDKHVRTKVVAELKRDRFFSSTLFVLSSLSQYIFFCLPSLYRFLFSLFRSVFLLVLLFSRVFPLNTATQPHPTPPTCPTKSASFPATVDQTSNHVLCNFLLHLSFSTAVPPPSPYPCYKCSLFSRWIFF